MSNKSYLFNNPYRHIDGMLKETLANTGLES